LLLLQPRKVHVLKPLLLLQGVLLQQLSRQYCLRLLLLLLALRVWRRQLCLLLRACDVLRPLLLILPF
jgi:hypothetical protein